MNKFIKENISFCNNEDFEIANIEIKRTQEIEKRLKTALRILIKKEKVDAIWVANDNRLVNGKFIAKIWRPICSKYKIPIVVGASSLVQPNLNFGTFAVIPDHKALGSQAAEMIFELQENDWKVEQKKIVPPLSVIKIRFSIFSNFYGCSYATWY